MKRVKTIWIEFKNDNTLVIQDVTDHHITMGYLDIYVYDMTENEERYYHIDITEVRYWEVIIQIKEGADE